MKKIKVFSALAFVLLFLSAYPAFSATIVEPYVIPVDAYITPYTSYIYAPGNVTYKTAYWGGGTGIYSGNIDACISHSRNAEDVWVKVESNWYDDTYFFSSTSKTSLYFGIARFDSTSPGTKHKQKLYVASGGSSDSAYSEVIER